MSEDYNKMTPARTYQGEKGSVWVYSLVVSVREPKIMLCLKLVYVSHSDGSKRIITQNRANFYVAIKKLDLLSLCLCFCSWLNFFLNWQLSGFAFALCLKLCENWSQVLTVCACAAHQGRVTVVLFVLEMEWLLSTGQDKNFTWHCSESGQQLGTHRTSAWVSGLQYPSISPNTYTCMFVVFVSALKLYSVNFTAKLPVAVLSYIQCFGLPYIITTHPMLRQEQGHPRLASS